MVNKSSKSNLCYIDSDLIAILWNLCWVIPSVPHGPAFAMCEKRRKSSHKTNFSQNKRHAEKRHGVFSYLSSQRQTMKKDRKSGK